MATSRDRRGSPVRAVTAAIGIALALSACSVGATTHATAAPRGHASAGALSLAGGYVPKPASPDLAAAYFTLTNSSGEPVHLTRVTTSASGHVLVMKDVTTGNVSTMVNIPVLSVPAHGRLVLSPGTNHLMLMDLHKTLAVGDRVHLVLTFSPAGVLRVDLPVTTLSGVSSDQMPGM